jgi:hypothetical protein
MLVTSTLLFLGLILWTTGDWIRGALAGDARRATLHRRARANMQFLLGFLGVLTLLYTLYLTSS